jgi:hypothetical protein
MDSDNLFLLILAGIAVAGTLRRSTPVASNRGWLAVSAFIIAAAGLAFLIAPDSAGLVAFILSLVLLTLPSLGAGLFKGLQGKGNTIGRQLAASWLSCTRWTLARISSLVQGGRLDSVEAIRSSANL